MCLQMIVNRLVIIAKSWVNLTKNLAVFTDSLVVLSENFVTTYVNL